METVTVSYGRVMGKAKNYPYFQPALYEKKKLKNGKIVWSYVCHLGTARRSVKLAEKDAIKFASERNCSFQFNVRHLNIAEEINENHLEV